MTNFSSNGLENSNGSHLTALKGGGEDSRRHMKGGETIAVGAAIGVAALAALGIGRAVIKENQSPSPDAKAAKAEKQAGTYLNKLHANGEQYSVTVPTGGSATSVLEANEPQAFNGSQALHDALIKDIENQAANNSTMLQSGQSVEVPDVPDGVTVAPKNFIGHNPDINKNK